MKIVPRDVVAAYKALVAIAGVAPLHIKEAILFFFINRMFVLCAEKNLISVEQHEEYISVFLKMIADLDKAVVEKYSEAAKQRAENAMSDDEEQADTGYFSILSYAFAFLLNHNNEYINYASDRYLGGIESYLIDSDADEIDNEITNIELLTEVVTALDENEILKELPILGVWASSVSPGVILPGYGKAR